MHLPRPRPPSAGPSPRHQQALPPAVEPLEGSPCVAGACGWLLLALSPHLGFTLFQGMEGGKAELRPASRFGTVLEASGRLPCALLVHRGWGQVAAGDGVSPGKRSGAR